MLKMALGLIYGCGDCHHWFVIPSVYVYGTWLIFFILSAGRWTAWFVRVYLDVCFFRRKVWWGAITRNIEWSPGVRGLFLSPSPSWVSHYLYPDLLYRYIAFLSIANWLFSTYILRIGISCLERCDQRREEKRRAELLEISGSSLRDCSSPQTPAPLHRSLIKDSHCPRPAPLSARGPSRFAVLLQVDSVHLSPRNRQNSGFQSAGPLAFPCLWEIKKGTSGWFTPPLFIPLHQKTRRWGGGGKEETCQG